MSAWLYLAMILIVMVSILGGYIENVSHFEIIWKWICYFLDFLLYLIHKANQPNKQKREKNDSSNRNIQGRRPIHFTEVKGNRNNLGNRT